MKTAISLPDIIYKQAEVFARKTKKSRSQLYTEAIKEYLARHTPDVITESMNKVCDLLEKQDTTLTQKAASELLKQESW
ncbi:MAG: hypothetical protein JXJ04_08580 [Spirochaetales bacterium]|nr:hypothetical protein [Spirochaetales bacterium]